MRVFFSFGEAELPLSGGRHHIAERIDKRLRAEKRGHPSVEARRI